MDAPLQNLRILRDELVDRGWVLTCFPFVYKRHKYFVIIQRYVRPEVAPEYQLVKLTFVDSSDTRRTLTAPANTRRIDIGAQELREYFGIDWAPNLGELLTQFCGQLGSVIPRHLPAVLSPEERKVVLQQLSKGDSEDPNKIFCRGVRRNVIRDDGKLGQRTLFNSQKTAMLRPELYEALKHDGNISFVYSEDSSKERSDADILESFKNRV